MSRAIQPFLVGMAVLIVLAFVPSLTLAAAVKSREFMPLSRDKPSFSMATSVSILRADSEPLPSGFMTLDRTTRRALSPSRKPVIHSTQRLGKPRDLSSSTAIEKDSALELVRTSERAIEASVDVHEVVRRAGATVAHAWPLPSSATQELTSGYGIRRDPFTKEHRFHEGMDIAAQAGTAVLASADGVIDRVAIGKDYGKFVTIRHRDGSKSVYGHLSAQSVHEDQRVKQGQKIGEVGSSGRSTGPHLHYELQRQGNSVNPVAVLTPPSRRALGVASR